MRTFIAVAGTAMALVANPVLADNSVVDTELDDLRGGTLTIVNEQNVVGDMSNNTINGSPVTGDNLIGQGALIGTSGLTTVIQNTGNQVLIQNSTIVNVTLR